MSLKEAIDLLNDLVESHNQIALRLKLLEIEIKSIKENLPGRLINIVEKTRKIDQKIGQKYINELLTEKVSQKSSYQKGSFDEQLIEEFLEKQQKIQEKIESKKQEETTESSE